jgi:pimeloyl-ACP methyl ester carboxylesterase
MREWFIPELQESMGSSAHDVQLIIDYLARRGDLSVDKVGMFGQGSGGAIAILAAAADPRIRAIDLLNPWGDWPDWLKDSPLLAGSDRASYLTPEFLQKAAPVEPIAYLPQLKDRALRVQQIMDYPNNPPAARDKIAASVPSDELVQYKDRTAHAEAWKTAGLSGWLAHQLQPESGKGPESARE